MGFFYQDVPDPFPEVDPICGKVLGGFLLQIAAFGFHYFLEGAGKVGIKWRQQAGPELEPEFLHIGRIEGEIVFAERADAHQRKLALEEIQELRQFVDPERPQHFAP